MHILLYFTQILCILHEKKQFLNSEKIQQLSIRHGIFCCASQSAMIDISFKIGTWIISSIELLTYFSCIYYCISVIFRNYTSQCFKFVSHFMRKLFVRDIIKLLKLFYRGFFMRGKCDDL